MSFPAAHAYPPVRETTRDLTAGARRVLSFPVEQQSRKLWCWAAVSSATSNYFGATPARSQCEIARLVWPSRTCCAADGDCDAQVPRIRSPGRG